MATRIQSLFLVRASFSCSNREDWAADAIAFFEADGVTPIPLAGIAFRSTARVSRDSTAAFVALGSPGVGLSVPAATPRGLLLTGGALGNVLGFYAPFSRGPAPLPGSYIGDVLATADGITKRVVEYDLTILRGLTQ